jgi:hypothetical protein
MTNIYLYLNQNTKLFLTNPIKKSDDEHFTIKFRITDKKIFYDLDENIISLKLLENVKMRFIPIINLKLINIYKRGTSILIDMMSAVITHIYPKELKYNRVNTIKHLRTDNQEQYLRVNY